MAQFHDAAGDGGREIIGYLSLSVRYSHDDGLDENQDQEAQLCFSNNVRRLQSQ
jgi:hypothetical protein